MKAIPLIKVLFLLLMSCGNLLAQDMIYSEEFTDQLNKGNDGGLIDLTDINWTLNTDACTVESGDYVKVVSTSGGRFEALDCDGEAVWTSSDIDISAYTDISISILAAETGSGSTAANKFIKLYYIIDGGSEISFFESSVDWTSTTATVGSLNGNNLQLVARMKTTYASDKIYIDDISVNGTPVEISNDALTQVLAPTSQVDVQSISSVVNEMNSAQSLLRFRLSENGSTDGLDTKIASISFNNVAATNKADLSTQFEGFVLHDGTNYITSSGMIINADELTLNFDDGIFSLSDNSSQEYELRGYLKATGIEDGKNVQIELAASAVGLTTYTSGSGFEPEQSIAVNSPVHSIDVLASHLNFTSVPEDDIVKNTNFSLGVEVIDTNGNMDLDASDEVSLNLATGSGILGGILSGNLSSGQVNFTDLNYDTAESIVIQASSTGLQSTDSSPISFISSQSTDLSLPVWTPESLEISSLINSLDQALKIYRFSLIDGGDDSESTFLNALHFLPGDNNTVNWQEVIAGFAIKVGDVSLDADFSFDNTGLNISIPDTEALREVREGSVGTFSIFTYLKTRVQDGEILQMKIENSHAGWGTSGSGLVPTFTGDLSGFDFTIEVEGTELIFTDKPPGKIAPNTSFSIELKTVDELGNQDVNAAVEACVSLASGSGQLSSNSGLSQSLMEGKYSWSDLSYDEAENFTILVEADGMNSILSDNISSLDVNSIVTTCETSIPSMSLNPMATRIENSEAVLNFTIKDEGSFDKEPSLISSMRFYNTFPESGIDWKRHIAGAALIQDGVVVASTTKIEEDYISFTSLEIEIPSTSQIDYELAVFFKKSLLPDHATLQVEIRKDHDWKASSTASGLLDEFPVNIRSAIHSIEVEADRLSFISAPTGIAPNETFSIVIASVDENQNIDLDQSFSLSLNILSGEGTLSQSGPVGNLVDGVLVLNDLAYSGSAPFELSVSGDLNSTSKKLFVQEDALAFSDDFESQSLTTWENSDDWTSSSYLPIDGDFSLKHNLSNAIGSSYILRPLEDIYPGKESIFWEFCIKNSDWDPSSTNYFVYHLLMDFNDPDLADNLYSVGVNLSGTDDKLSLWKTVDDESEVLIKSDFDWNESEAICLKLEYTAKGEWILFYNRLGEKVNWLNAGSLISEVPENADNWYSGLEFNFETASRAGELWFDDLKIECYNTPPFLKTYTLLADSILLDFSEDLNFIESSQNGSFELRLGGAPVPIKDIKSTTKNNQILIITEDNLLTGQYQLKTDGIIDLDGAISQHEIVEFKYFARPKAFDLVINEIFADESPSVGLPEYEFIELYNTSDYPINIKDYKLKVGNYEKVLLAAEISAHSYLILCANAATELYSSFGNTLGVSSFPALTNSGTSIQIESSLGLLIDEVNYSGKWYGDDEKRDGGWSLERIDPNNHSWQVDNWEASLDESGGTPGKVNSIYGTNPDVTPPQLVGLEVSGSNTLVLFFSERLLFSQALSIQNYSVKSEHGKPTFVEEFEDDVFALRLTFSDVFEHNIQYTLSLSDQLVDLAGNPIEESEFDFSIAELAHEGDIVINEVLFNPYPGGADYVELLNISDRIIDVRDLYLANRDADYQLDAVYRVSEKSRILKAGAYLLLSADTTNVKLNYSNFDESAFIELKKMPAYNDDEGRVVILNANDELLDDLAYDEDMQYKLWSSTEGMALERINPESDTNSASNWQTAAQSIGFGTPGVQNSAYDIEEVEVNLVGFKEKIFSPDNDGVDDKLIINFDLDKSGYVANIRIYNSFGREVRRLANNLSLATEDQLFWDGLLASNERAPLGIYVFYFELFHADGEVKTYKKTCVLGGKFK